MTPSEFPRQDAVGYYLHAAALVSVLRDDASLAPYIDLETYRFSVSEHVFCRWLMKQGGFRQATERLQNEDFFRALSAENRLDWLICLVWELVIPYSLFLEIKNGNTQAADRLLDEARFLKISDLAQDLLRETQSTSFISAFKIHHFQEQLKDFIGLVHNEFKDFPRPETNEAQAEAVLLHALIWGSIHHVGHIHREIITDLISVIHVADLSRIGKVFDAMQIEIAAFKNEVEQKEDVWSRVIIFRLEAMLSSRRGACSARYSAHPLEAPPC